MKRTLLTLISFLFVFHYASAQYLISTGGTVSTCSGNFYDNGGLAADYGNNRNDTMTFCSNNAANIEITLSNVGLANGDILSIYHGSEIIAANLIGSLTNVNGANYAKITSNCNCITFVFSSNGSGTRSGWDGLLTCTTPTAVVNDEIFNASAITLNGTCLTNQTLVGATADYASGCFTSANTVWYEINLTGGNNSIDVSLANTAIGANVEYLLAYGDPCASTITVEGAQCGLVGASYQWTNLTENLYYLGVSSVTEGLFDICITESYTDVCGDYYCGAGENCNTCPFDCGSCAEATGGPYFHPVIGVQNTYVGQCMVTTCSGRYYDNGGAAGNYALNINQIYRTFCPSTPLSAIRATVNSMQIEYPGGAGCTDILWVQNGPTQNSNILWQGCGNTTLPVVRTMAGAYSAGVFTSTHPSGCLTFRFASGAATAWAGWDISLSCVPFASGPPASYNFDCQAAVPICNDITVNSQVWGPGTTSEGCGSCVTSENFTEWYHMHVATGGTMQLEIKPNGISDMDFAIYKSNGCGSLGSPLRCSFAAYVSPGKTGLSSAAGDLSEDVSGDQWVAELPIIAGEEYYIMVNEWNKLNPNQYTLDWVLTDGASFDCSITLPVSMLDFYAERRNDMVDLKWVTASETNNDFFTIERSIDGIRFNEIGTMAGAGNSNNVLSYLFIDQEPYHGIAYYRIKQTDFDGKFEYSGVVSIDFNNSESSANAINIYPNPAVNSITVRTSRFLVAQEFEIYNSQGVCISKGVLNGMENRLSLDQFSGGLYLFSLGNQSKQKFYVVKD